MHSIELRKISLRELRAFSHTGSVETVVANLEASFAAIDLEHPHRGVALLAGADLAYVIPLDVAVEPRCVVGPHFAVTELATDIPRVVRARVLVLSLAQTRCIDITRLAYQERHDDDFPVVVEAPMREETPHRDFALDEAEHAEAARFVFRSVDTALKKIHDGDLRPIVLMGAERDLSYWDDVSTSPAPVIGRVHGNYEWAGMAQIANLAAPALELHQHAKEQAAVDEVRDKLASGAVCGIADVWAVARSGRGYRLAVEEGYHFNGRIDRDGIAPAARDACDAFDVVDDAIRQQVCHAGDVIVTHAGMLADYGRIAMVLRY